MASQLTMAPSSDSKLTTGHYTGIHVSYLRSFAYTGNDHIPDALGIEYFKKDHEHALHEIFTRIQQEMMTWNQDTRWRIDLWRRPPSSAVNCSVDNNQHISHIEHQIQAMNEQQARRALVEAMLRVKQYEVMTSEQYKELAKLRQEIGQLTNEQVSLQLNQLCQHYTHKEQERELQHAVELRLKAQEVRALSKRVDLLKATIHQKIESQPEAIEKLKQIEMAALDDRKHHLKEQRALRRKV
ncbi:hypothetical protein BDF19DRAFT_453783 [Syncephalis fuscata]|nr:hypothetical protein BDF19DRAFT_453783 [Syncephalis fuscata]